MVCGQSKLVVWPVWICQFTIEAPLFGDREHSEVAASDFEMPMTVDLEGFTYMRQWDQGILVGIYEIEHEHWAMDGAPWNYGMELFNQDFDRIENELALSFDRYPC